MARNPRSFTSDSAKSQENNTENTQVDTTEATEATEAKVEPTEVEVDLSKMTAAQRIAYLAQQKTGAKSKKAAEKKASEAKPKITVYDPENGQPIARTDLIRRLWTQDKLSRSAITSVLNDPSVNPPTKDEAGNEVPAKKIPYQIVFAATKGLEGGPPKAAEDTNASKAEGENGANTDTGAGNSEAA